MIGKKKVMLAVTILIVVGALLTLVATSFNQSLVYFYTTTEIQAQGERANGKKVRIGGMVQEGSLHREAGSTKIRFLLTDGTTRLPIRYEGITPDLFREGQGAVVEGAWNPGQDFVADTILAKHSEDYVPVQMTPEGVAKAKESILKSLK